MSTSSSSTQVDDLMRTIDVYLTHHIRPQERELVIRSKLNPKEIGNNRTVKKMRDQDAHLLTHSDTDPIYSHIVDEYNKSKKAVVKLFTTLYPNISLLTKELQEQFAQDVIVPYILDNNVDTSTLEEAGGGEDNDSMDAT